MSEHKRKAVPAHNKKMMSIVEVEKNVEKEEEKYIEKRFNYFVPIIKANKERRTVCGVVLKPEVTDAQGSIMSEEVIENAAHKFLSEFNVKTKLGLMHKDFKPRFQLYESYIAPQPLIINGEVVSKGSWIIVVKVLDSKVWKLVKDGKIAGFSIGGRAKVRRIAA